MALLTQPDPPSPQTLRFDQSALITIHLPTDGSFGFSREWLSYLWVGLRKEKMKTSGGPPMTTHVSRRRFLIQVAAAPLPLFVPSHVLAKPPRRKGAGDVVRLGFIGVGRRGQQLLESMPERAKVVAVCDVYRPRAEAVGMKYNAKAFTDFREIIDRKNFDAVVVATPDHWHALPAILACQAGKDVYCEKPLALTVAEGRLMVKAAREHDRVFQVGTQQRSLRPNEEACRLIREGAMGHVRRVVVANNWSPTDERLPGEGVPEGLDWNAWLGQAPGDIAFNRKYIYPENDPGWSDRRFFCGGETCGWGAHGYDQLQWAMGYDKSGPKWVEAEGHEGNSIVRWWYDCDTIVETGDAPKAGGWFYCERGRVNVDRNRFNVMPGELKVELLRGVEVSETPEQAHMANFLDCVRTRKRPNADVEIGQRSVTVAHLANIARLVDGRLEWDSVAERFRNNDRANELLAREWRQGFELPEV